MKPYIKWNGVIHLDQIIAFALGWIVAYHFFGWYGVAAWYAIYTTARHGPRAA